MFRLFGHAVTARVYPLNGCFGCLIPICLGCHMPMPPRRAEMANLASGSGDTVPSADISDMIIGVREAA